MTIVSNDPTLWPTINIHGVSSYFAVAAFVGVSYDWVLTFGREVELIWRQRWSLITALYLSVRYLGILLAILSVLSDVGNISLTDTENSLDTLLYAGFLEILTVVQMFLLGPRLILSIREYHAKLVVDSDSATGMTSMAFQERVRISTSGSV
ncbi:uncharacterized protein EDB93DRAFT_1252620 [Suillus bovinus]|uniref:uncharacterized protein n=1 Tax=Suillus bovinus TaxID=48563 RepID=UPI001B87F7C2|nr:uncharacterized protein EDB93DRAFT_1252620 [Suillus bovinus]KAG2141153.1 hypothetical protein EDB93DRAFT_1252620 [Suillus bovinus]